MPSPWHARRPPAQFVDQLHFLGEVALHGWIQVGAHHQGAQGDAGEQDAGDAEGGPGDLDLGDRIAQGHHREQEQQRVVGEELDRRFEHDPSKEMKLVYGRWRSSCTPWA